MTASDIRAIFTERYKYRFREVGLFEFGINEKVFDAFIIMPDRQYFKGFEFKVSRSDFLSDLKQRERIRFDMAARSYAKCPSFKWREYLKYCHAFYFVCPVGLISVDEVEAPAGLIWVKVDGGLKVMKRPKRTTTMDPQLVQRILFFFASRAKTRSGRYF